MRSVRRSALGATALALAVATALAACSSGGGGTTSGGGATVASKLVLGGPPECATRVTCKVGVEQTYNVKVGFPRSLQSLLTTSTERTHSQMTLLRMEPPVSTSTEGSNDGIRGE